MRVFQGGDDGFDASPIVAGRFCSSKGVGEPGGKADPQRLVTAAALLLIPLHTIMIPLIAVRRRLESATTRLWSAAADG
jgi:hypothetical protein